MAAPLNPEAMLALYPTMGKIEDNIPYYLDGTVIEYDEAAVAAKTAEIEAEYPWRALRHERDRLLSRTDWWATSDRTMTAEQTAYRQALRDLPANTVDPENPVWPAKP